MKISHRKLGSETATGALKLLPQGRETEHPPCRGFEQLQNQALGGSCQTELLTTLQVNTALHLADQAGRHRGCHHILETGAITIGYISQEFNISLVEKRQGVHYFENILDLESKRFFLDILEGNHIAGHHLPGPKGHQHLGANEDTIFQVFRNAIGEEPIFEPLNLYIQKHLCVCSEPCHGSQYNVRRRSRISSSCIRPNKSVWKFQTRHGRAAGAA